MYSYTLEKQNIFTEDGQVMFLKIRDNVERLIRQAGAVRMQEAIQGQSGETWLMLACVDRLVELKEIKEVTVKNTVLGQHRVFVRRN